MKIPNNSHPAIKKAIDHAINQAVGNFENARNAEEAFDGGSYSPAQELLEDIEDVCRKEGCEDNVIDVFEPAAAAALPQVRKRWKQFQKDFEMSKCVSSIKLSAICDRELKRVGLAGKMTAQEYADFALNHDKREPATVVHNLIALGYLPRREAEILVAKIVDGKADEK